MFLVYRFQGPTGKSYIGMTGTSLEKRVAQHFYLARKGQGYALHKALRKYGENSFSIEILAKTESEAEAIKLEEMYIKQFDSIANGYNCIGGYNISGKSAGKYISEKRKEFFSVKENRERHSEDHGGESFLVYDLISRDVVGTWVNQAIAAEFLGVSVNALNNVLNGRSKTVSRFVAVKEKEKDNLYEMIKLAPKPFYVLDRSTGIKTEWISKSECSKTLGISRSTIRKLINGGHISDYRYEIKEIYNG